MPKARSSEAHEYLRQALIGLMRLKIATGTSTKDLRQLALGCIAEAQTERRSGVGAQGLDIHRMASVLRAWHKETKYLKSDGTPSPLPTIGNVSLSRLVGEHYPQRKIKEVIGALSRAGLIKQSMQGRWTPTDYQVPISANTQEILDHASEGVSRFLETVLNNVSTTDKSKVLFERSCKVRNLPFSHHTEFRKVVRDQAIAFMTAVDDWLEARTVNVKKGRSARNSSCAGVFTFAYLGNTQLDN